MLTRASKQEEPTDDEEKRGQNLKCIDQGELAKGQTPGSLESKCSFPCLSKGW
jgi:hypothetical protein